MHSAPACDDDRNENGHVLSCRCGDCMPAGADPEADLLERRRAIELSMPRWARLRPAQVAWKRDLSS